MLSKAISIVAGGIGLHGGEIICLPSLSQLPLTLDYTPSRHPDAATPSLRERPAWVLTPWRTAVTCPPAPSLGAEDFDLIPPDTGIIRIDGYDDTGFIVGDVQVEGSIICCEDLWLCWSPTMLGDITPDSVTGIFDLLKPIPELLVLGTGSRTEPVPEGVLRALRERGVSIEVLDTVNAIATFNILNQEGRKVVGALLPAGIGVNEKDDPS